MLKGSTVHPRDSVCRRADTESATEHQNEVVLEYIDGFLGYGNLESNFWFLGMEEGGGSDLVQVKERFRLWDRNGRNPTEDLPSFQTEIGIKEWFRRKKPRLQPTWRRLIRIYLRAKGRKVTRESILDFQLNFLGRRNDRSTPCLFELMPLPSPGLDECPCHWLARYPHLKFLRDREAYAKHVLCKRVELAREHIWKAQHRSSLMVVCFYGLGYLPHWEKIADAKFREEKECDWHFYHALHNGTLFVALIHPTAFGLRNSYFDSIGLFIGKKLRWNLA